MNYESVETTHPFDPSQKTWQACYWRGFYRRRLGLVSRRLGRYKEMCDLTNVAEIPNELRTACSPNVNRLLFQLLGSETLNIATEEQLLHQIRLVAVKGLNKEVHRHTFHNIRQQEGEGITHFLGKLPSQARLCEFTVKCTNRSCQQQVNYSEYMVAGQLVAGLLNTEHQGKILASANILTTLEQKFDWLVSLETTEKATPPPSKQPSSTDDI